MELIIEGHISQILPLESGVGKTGKEWKRQNFVLNTDEQYPKKICFSLSNDNVDRYNLNQNDNVKVWVDIESREYNSRWYTDVRAWKVEIKTNPPPYQPQPEPQAQFNEPQANDDLPF